MTYNQAADELSERQRRNLEIVERHVVESHESRMKAPRQEREKLREEYVRRFGGAALFEFSKRFRVFPLLLLLPCLLFAQVPPMPQVEAMRSLGRQSPYVSTVDVWVTNTVTTVQTLTFLRTIRLHTDGTNNIFRTNFMLMDTNQVSCVTNTSPVKLE